MSNVFLALYVQLTLTYPWISCCTSSVDPRVKFYCSAICAIHLIAIGRQINYRGLERSGRFIEMDEGVFATAKVFIYAYRDISPLNSMTLPSLPRHSSKESLKSGLYHIFFRRGRLSS